MGAQIWLCVCVRQGPAQALVEIAVSVYLDVGAQKHGADPVSELN